MEVFEDFLGAGRKSTSEDGDNERRSTATANSIGPGLDSGAGGGVRRDVPMEGMDNTQVRTIVVTLYARISPRAESLRMCVCACEAPNT